MNRGWARYSRLTELKRRPFRQKGRYFWLSIFLGLVPFLLFRIGVFYAVTFPVTKQPTSRINVGASNVTRLDQGLPTLRERSNTRHNEAAWKEDQDFLQNGKDNGGRKVQGFKRSGEQQEDDARYSRVTGNFDSFGLHEVESSATTSKRDRGAKKFVIGVDGAFLEGRLIEEKVNDAKDLERESEELERKGEKDRKLKEEEERKLKEEEERKLKEEKRKLQEEARRLKEEEERKLKEEKRKLKEEEERKLKEEKRKLKEEEESKLKKEDERKLKEEGEHELKEKEKRKLKVEEERRRVVDEGRYRKRGEDEGRKEGEEEARKREKEERKLKAEKERKVNEEKPKPKEEHERKLKKEDEHILKEEAEPKLKEEEERRRVEVEGKKRGEEEARKRGEEERKLKEEEKRKLKEEEERKLKEEDKRNLKEEGEHKLNEGKERKLKDEEERKKAEDETRKREKERRQKGTAEFQRKEESFNKEERDAEEQPKRKDGEVNGKEAAQENASHARKDGQIKGVEENSRQGSDSNYVIEVITATDAKTWDGGGGDATKTKETQHTKHKISNKETKLVDKTQEESSKPAEIFQTGVEKWKSGAGDCDLYDGVWEYDEADPLYTNDTCPYMQRDQNCLANGRPDRMYLHWRWKPRGCDLPRFDAEAFMQVFKGKTVGFVGDSLARNQMQSLLCMLTQVETPILLYDADYTAKYSFEQHQLNLLVVWAPYLVKHSDESVDGYDLPSVLHMDVLDLPWTSRIGEMDLMIVSVGQWFFKAMLYVKKEGKDVLGCYQCAHLNVTDIGFLNIFRESLRQGLERIASEMKGIVILTTFGVQHYEHGAWNTGWCRREKPLKAEETPGFGWMNNEMRGVVLDEFTRIRDNRSQVDKALSFDFIDITRVNLLRADAHPGPYRRPYPYAHRNASEWVQNDCLHWCMPGPVDTWNQLLFKVALRYL